MLGFEYGYSLADPQHAGAVGGAVRRLRQRRPGHHRPVHRLRRDRSGSACRGLVLLLPHGYEGQGPEHSSRPARALPAALRRAQHAGRATSPRRRSTSTPLRRQMQPQLPQAAGRDDAEEPAAPQAGGLAARRDGAGQPLPAVIGEIDAHRAGRAGAAASCSAPARSTTTCWRQRRERGIDDVAIVRVEQLYPFPNAVAAAALAPYRQRRGRLVPGGAGEHGRLAASSTAGSRRCCAARGHSYAGRAMSAAPPPPARPPGLPRRMRPSRPRLVDARADARLTADRIDRQRRSPDGDRDQGPALGESVTRRHAGALAEEGRRGGRAPTSRWSSWRPTRSTVEVNAPGAGVLARSAAERGRGSGSRRAARPARGRRRRGADPQPPRRRTPTPPRPPSAAGVNPPPRRPARSPAPAAAAAPIARTRRCPPRRRLMEEHGARPPARSATAPARTAASPRATCSPSSTAPAPGRPPAARPPQPPARRAADAREERRAA